MKITIGYLYPDMMSTFGDRGNVETVRRRCAWRGIGTEITELKLGDPIPAGLDLILIGGGGEAQQRLVAADLHKVKAPGIRDAVAGGTAALAVGGGFELFGRFCQPERGAEYPGVDLFDCWTIRRSTLLGDDYCTIAQAKADRVIGELVVQWDDRLLVGFENHSGGTYLGTAAQPLGLVLTGHGNSGTGTEGVILGSAVGTNLRGPCLPKNPALADFLIAAAVGRRQPGAELMPLRDELEQAAHDDCLQRVLPAGRIRRVRPGSAARTGPARQPRLTRPQPSPQRASRTTDAATRP